MKNYRGNIPKKSDGWGSIGDVQHEKERWMIFMRPQANSDEWMSVKICADGKVPSKGNYWLSWNAAEHRIARSREAGLMQSHRPELYQAVEVFFIEQKGNLNG